MVLANASQSISCAQGRWLTCWSEAWIPRARVGDVMDKKFVSIRADLGVFDAIEAGLRRAS